MRNSTNKKADGQLFKSQWEVTQYQLIKQKELTQAVLAAKETERAKIAQEIQENLNQVLIAALLYIELAKTDDECRQMCLEKSSLYISTVIKELAIMSRDLEGRDIDLTGDLG